MRTYNKDIVNEMIESREGRVALFGQDLFLFAVYYFPDFFGIKLADFQKEWLYSLQGDNNTYIKAFRETGKTTYAIIFLIWCICYKRKHFIMYYCYDKKKANANMHGLAMQLITNKRLIADYGYLYPGKNTKQEQDELQKKSIGEFITNNGVKCKSMSIGESPRGESFMHKEKVYRPDLAVLDDIDVDKSVRNGAIIEQNYNWLKGELMGGLSQDKNHTPKIVVLGNTIREDGLCPRLESDYKNLESWDVYIQPVRDEKGDIVWRFTEDDLAEKKKQLGTISYNQNFNLIPYVLGEKIITRDMIQYSDKTKFLSYTIGIDPAISTKDKSDPFGIVVTGHENDKQYVVESIELRGEQKSPAKSIVIIDNLYKKWKNSRVVCETVAFQQVYAKLLQARGIATEEVKPTRDKVTRLMEWQADFENGNIYFHHDCKNVVDQLLLFPDGIHDDMVDAMMYSFRVNREGPILAFG